MASGTYSNVPGWVKGAVVVALLAAYAGGRFIMGDAPLTGTIPGAQEMPTPPPPPTAAQLAKLVKTDEKVGTGAEAKKGDSVTLNYKGTLDDGTVFDESKPGKPFTFELGAGHTIPGFDYGILGMKVGGKRKINFPPDLGYGDKAQGKIPANSNLTFEIDLLKVEAAPKEPTPPMPPGAAAAAKKAEAKQQAKSSSDKPRASAKPAGATTEPQPGLKETDLVVGHGTEAKKGDKVSVSYRGTLQDGTVFDDSAQHGGSFDFQLGAGSVIPGWDAGVAGMKVGGKRRLVIAPDLAYGPNGQPPTIPPNATLTFDIELLKVN